MNCADSRIYLSAYLDEELGITESLHVQKHLTGCGGCRRDQDQQLALRSTLRQPNLYAHPSVDFSIRVEKVVRRAGQVEGRSRGYWLESSWVGASAGLRRRPPS
jgi:hypothetical protein